MRHLIVPERQGPTVEYASMYIYIYLVQVYGSHGNYVYSLNALYYSPFMCGMQFVVDAAVL